MRLLQGPHLLRPAPCVNAAPLCTARPSAPRRRHVALRVASIEGATGTQEPGLPQQPTISPVQRQQQQQPLSSVDDITDLELTELDDTQEAMLHWMINSTEQQQEEDLDEMVDYDEFGDEEYEELIEEVERLVEASGTNLNVGDRIVGTVYEVDEEGAYVEIGQKASGFVPLAECSFAKLKTPLEVLRVGMKREFIVVNREDEYGQTVLSLGAVEAGVFWQRIRQLHEEEHTVTVKVDSANKGGLLVQYGPYDGFVPVSQFGPQITLDNMESLVGQTIPVKFLEVDEERERLVFSSKRATGGPLPGADGQSFKSGDVVLGVVQSVKPYGAFIDVGGISGLLHVSQYSSERVLSMEKVVQEGDKLKVMILSLDRERGRVTLTTKKLEPNPGDMLRNPKLVFEKAEEMGAQFRQRMEEANRTALEAGGFQFPQS